MISDSEVWVFLFSIASSKRMEGRGGEGESGKGEGGEGRGEKHQCKGVTSTGLVASQPDEGQGVNLKSRHVPLIGNQTHKLLVHRPTL